MKSVAPKRGHQAQLIVLIPTPLNWPKATPQRVGIARALATEPAVLLVDEPTFTLEMGTTDSILDLLKAVRDRIGVTVVVITHEMSTVRKICDSVSLLQDGQVSETGTLDEILSTPTSELAKNSFHCLNEIRHN